MSLEAMLLASQQIYTLNICQLLPGILLCQDIHVMLSNDLSKNAWESRAATASHLPRECGSNVSLAMQHLLPRLSVTLCFYIGCPLGVAHL